MNILEQVKNKIILDGIERTTNTKSVAASPTTGIILDGIERMY